MILENVLFTPDVPNANGRIYPWDVVKKALAGAAEKIKNRSMVGGLVSERLERGYGHLNMCDIALVVHNVYIPKNKDEVRATVELLTKTERGALAAHGVECAKHVPASSEIRLCPYGTGRMEGNTVVEFELQGVDIEIVFKPAISGEKEKQA